MTPVIVILAVVAAVSISRAFVGSREKESRKEGLPGSHRTLYGFAMSGKTKTQRDITLQAVRLWPGKTVRELVGEIHASGVAIGASDGESKYTVARCLSALDSEAWIKRGPRRRCQAGGRLCFTWFPVKGA